MLSVSSTIGALRRNIYLRFPIRFFGVYLPLEFFYLAIISASHPDGKLYTPFVSNHLNIMNGLRNILLAASEGVLYMMGYATTRFSEHGLMIDTGGKVSLNNACLAWGVMSFWVAFIFANEGTWKMKAKWMLGGLLAICLINVARVVTLLVALNKKWSAIKNLDHHTTFNMVAYGFIFLLIFFYSRSHKKVEAPSGNIS